MILNPYAQPQALVPLTGTRLLQQDFGLLGKVIADTHKPTRKWCVQAVYAPLTGMARGGIRTKLVDDKGFITFINQMDLEVLLGLASPGDICRWSRERYSEPGDPDFYGFCVDDHDLLDDLLDRELLLRAESLTWMIPQNTEITRRVHHNAQRDTEDLYYLVWDGDPETGISPDFRMDTIERRWSRIERTKIDWEDA